MLKENHTFFQPQKHFLARDVHERRPAATLAALRWLLPPAAPGNPLRAGKRKNVLILAGCLWDSIQQFQRILPNTLKGKQIQDEGLDDYNSSEASSFIALKLFSRFFVPPSSALNAS